MVIALSSTASPVRSQSRGGGDGYLFKAPTVAWSLRAGVAQPRASGDLFAFVSERLTIDRADLAGIALATDVSVRLRPRLDVVIGAAISTREVFSEYRDFVDLDDLPIEQRTTFRRIPLTAGLKLHLRPDGRSVGRLAWVPARLSPYVAAGGGVMYYVFKQDGDFVDYQTLDVFPTTLRSSDVSAMAYGAFGGTYSMTPRIGLNTEIRYDYARGALGTDFKDFAALDLTSVGFTAGLLFRF